MAKDVDHLLQEYLEKGDSKKESDSRKVKDTSAEELVDDLEALLSVATEEESDSEEEDDKLEASSNDFDNPHQTYSGKSPVNDFEEERTTASIGFEESDD